MYGGGSCQMSVRRRWDERGGCRGGGDEVGIGRCLGEMVGVGRFCAVACNSRKCLERMLCSCAAMRSKRRIREMGRREGG